MLVFSLARKNYLKKQNLKVKVLKKLILLNSRNNFTSAPLKIGWIHVVQHCFNVKFRNPLHGGCIANKQTNSRGFVLFNSNEQQKPSNIFRLASRLLKTCFNLYRRLSRKKILQEAFRKVHFEKETKRRFEKTTRYRQILF